MNIIEIRVLLINGKMLKISIITATYNSAATVAECIKSVNYQTHRNIEHIIIDGSSNDDTIAIINSVPNRITKIVSERDTGIYDALNKGIRIASGDIIGFVHADDKLFSKTTLSDIVDVFKSSSCTVLYGNGTYVNNENKVIRDWISGDFDIQKVRKGWMPLHTTLYCKADLYRKYNYFSEKYRIASDYDFILKVFLDKENIVVYLNEYVIKMLMGGISTDPKFVLKKLKEDYLVMKSNKINPLKSLPRKILSKIPQFF